MTTEPTPEACCEHGEAIEKLAGELRRANQLLADLVEVRRGKTVRTCDEVHPEYGVHHPGGHPRPEEIQAFARDSYKVRIPGSSRAVERALERQASAMNDDSAHLLGDITERLRAATEGITLGQAEEVDVPTLDELRERGRLG